MLIGELASRSGTPRKRLRYYESVGILASERRANGYRDYPESAVATVRQIRALLAAGLPTTVISSLLPCARADGSLRACPGVVPRLHDHLERLNQRSAELDEARQALRTAIAAAEQSAQGS